MGVGSWLIGYNITGRYLYEGIQYSWRFDVVKEVIIVFRGITEIYSIKCNRVEDKKEMATNLFMQKHIEKWVQDEKAGRHGYHIEYD